jgi:hypothetical protein
VLLTTGLNSQIHLNAENQILLNTGGAYTGNPFTGDSYPFSIPPSTYELIDLNKHTTTPIPQLVSPADLAKYGFFASYAIDDNGDILAQVGHSGSSQLLTVLLTPPAGSAQVPEPTTLATLAAGVGGLLLRRRFARKR